MNAGIIAGLDYYDPQTWSGAIRCADCLYEQDASRELLESLPVVYVAGEPLSTGNARRKPAGLFTGDDCDECDTCARPVCNGLVCGACGFAPGCEEHDEGHHPTCPEKPGIVFSEAASDLLRCTCGNDVMADGFYPADPETGAEVEPEPGKWNGRRYRCGSCGANYDQEAAQ